MLLHLESVDTKMAGEMDSKSQRDGGNGIGTY